MPDSKKTEHLCPDEIEAMLLHSGAKAPEVDRLARIVSGIQHLEWQLARRAHAAHDKSPGEMKTS